MIAHQGGWDELLIVGIPVLLYLAYSSSRARRERRAGRAPGPGPCLYCGTMLGSEATRCPMCGFRAKRGVT